MDPTLGPFIDHARAKGLDHATIRMLLLAAGWKEKEIARALVEHSLDMPVPAPPDVGGAREAFLHLVSFAALYTTVIAVLALVFTYLDVLLPDPAVSQYALSAEQVRSSIRWEMSAVIVASPIFLWISSLLLREMRATPDKARSPVRRWLTYLTLFVASVTIGVTLITLVSSLLGGELTVRFLLKVVVVFVVAGACYAYYFLSLRMPPEEARTTRLHTRFGWAAGAAVLATIVGGMTLTGLPTTERLRRFDARRIEDLRTIADEALNISLGPRWRSPQAAATLRQPLPRSLDEVAAGAVQRRPRIADPVTHERYGYEVVNETRFRLCATFDQLRDEPLDVRWNHPAGRHCFEVDAMNPPRVR
jgi:hypothetical protein